MLSAKYYLTKFTDVRKSVAFQDNTLYWVNTQAMLFCFKAQAIMGKISLNLWGGGTNNSNNYKQADKIIGITL